MNDPRLELLERFMDAMSTGDGDRAVEVLSDDVILDWSRSLGPYAGVRSGHDGARELIANFFEVWDELQLEALDSEALGPDQLAVQTRLSGKGRGSGVAVQAQGAQLTTFRDGLVCRSELFQDIDEACLHSRRSRLAEANLYFVCEGRPNGEDPEHLLAAAIAGGVDVVQLREQAPRCAEEVTALAEPFARAARQHGVLFFLNDQPELVAAAGADGVHVGQDDAAVDEARAVAGAGALVGLSTHTPAQFDAAAAAEGSARPDQISVGPVWETPTKPGRAAAGLGLVEHAARSEADVPWFAIGGIEPGNVAEVVAAGARRAVVVRAIRDAPDPRSAAAELRSALVNGQT